jgi:predicted dehydrogenase
MPEADVVAGVDIAPKSGITFRGVDLPIYGSPADAAAHHDVDVAVIATPTPAHAAACSQIADCLPGTRILVEKPAAADLADAEYILKDIGARQPVDVAYHMAFSPEVTWAVSTAAESAGALGLPASIESYFADPYSDEFEPASAKLGNSWIDSGINALSVLCRFAQPTGRTSLRRIGDEPRSVFEAHIECEVAGKQIDALILTSWHAADPAKTTTIRYDSGAELTMDHTAVGARLISGHDVAGICGYSARVPRRERHYRAMYQSWLRDGHPIASAQTHLLLHRLLLGTPAPG